MPLQVACIAFEAKIYQPMKVLLRCKKIAERYPFSNHLMPLLFGVLQL